MKKKVYNESYFEKIDTEDKAYFLGLIYSDGCIINNKNDYRYKVSLKLHIKDKHILEDFIKHVKGEMSLWFHGQRNMCEVSLSGKKIVKDLEEKGLHPNKTFTIKYPKINEDLERHFLRGYFDGDGCVRVKTDKRDGSKRGDLRLVSGSIEMIDSINQRMNVLFGTSLNKIYGPTNKEYKFIGWSSMNDIETIYEGFYNNSNLFLSRKKTIFDEVIFQIKNKKKYRKK